jgi:hypothetical protein
MRPSAAHKSFLAKDLVNLAVPHTMKKPATMQGVAFGTVFAPHMFVCDWNVNKGWGRTRASSACSARIATLRV